MDVEIVGDSHQTLTIWTVMRKAHGILMDHCVAPGLTGACVPNLRGAIQRSGDNLASIRTEFRVVDLLPMLQRRANRQSEIALRERREQPSSRDPIRRVLPHQSCKVSRPDDRLVLFKQVLGSLEFKQGKGLFGAETLGRWA